MDRAVSPVVAIVALLAITVVGAASVVTIATGLDVDGERGSSTPTIAVSADVEGQRITLAHRGGPAIDLTNCSLTIRIGGEPLAHQPPVPYFAAEGFRGTPTGAFNVGSDGVLAPGDRASLQLASTNAPRFAAGDRVTLTIRRDGSQVATGSVRAS